SLQAAATPSLPTPSLHDALPISPAAATRPIQTRLGASCEIDRLVSAMTNDSLGMGGKTPSITVHTNNTSRTHGDAAIARIASTTDPNTCAPAVGPHSRVPSRLCGQHQGEPFNLALQNRGCRRGLNPPASRIGPEAAGRGAATRMQQWSPLA